MRGTMRPVMRGIAPFDPIAFLSDGSQGAILEARKLDTLFQNSAGTTPITANGQPLGLWKDSSPNTNNAVQTTAAARPTYHTDGTYHWFTSDAVDDNLHLNLPAGNYTILHATLAGVIEYESVVPIGGIDLTASPAQPVTVGLTGLLASSKPVPANAKAYMEALGSGTKFTGVTSMFAWFLARPDITAINTSDWDVSSVTDFTAFCDYMENLTTLDVSNWDTSSVQSFNFFVGGCPLLQALDVSNWDTSQVTNFSYFAESCATLTELDVSNWDTANVTDFSNFIVAADSITTLDLRNWNTSQVTTFYQFAFTATSLTDILLDGGTGNPFSDSPCTDYGGAFLATNLTQASIDKILIRINNAGTSNGVFNQSGGSAPGIVGRAAIDALRARGWTVTVTGGY